MRFPGIHRHGLLPGMVVDSLNGQRSPAHVACQALDGFPVGAVNGLSHINVESGVVLPRHQPFDLVGVKDIMVFAARSETRCGNERQQQLRSTPSAHENILPEQAREAPAHEHGDGS